MYVFVDLVLQHEWMGHPAGSRVRLLEGIALQLIARQVAVLADSAVEDKGMNAPPKDKMVRRVAMSK